MDCKQYAENLRKAKQGIPNFIEQTLRNAQNDFTELVVSNTPVDTGALQAGWEDGPIKVSSNSGSAEVYNFVFYAKFVEFGTRYMEPRYFMTKSAQQYEILFRALCIYDFEKYWKGCGV